MPYKAIWIFLASIFVLIGLVIACFGWQDIFQAQASQLWQPADGIIVSSDLGVRTNDDGATLYSADIHYTYQVSGRELKNDRVFFGQLSTSDRQPIFDILLKYEQGDEVIVYYNPDDPVQSVLEPGVHGVTWFLPALGTGFAVLGLIFVGIGLRFNFGD
jgi:hypothetical protein